MDPREQIIAAELKMVRVAGLSKNPDLARAASEREKELRAELRQICPAGHDENLSMPPSADFSSFAPAPDVSINLSKKDPPLPCGRSLCIYCPHLALRKAALLLAIPGVIISYGCCPACLRHLKQNDGADGV